MEQDRNWNVTIRGTSQFDDEITLPLRIICERKPEAVRVNPTQEAPSNEVRRSNGNPKPIRAA
jgi:hypothetical protein